MNNLIELKTEQTLPSKTEPTDDELAMPLPSGETQDEIHNGHGPATVGEQSPTGEFNKMNDSIHQHSTKDPLIMKAQYLPVLSSISESNSILLLCNHCVL